VAIYLSGQRVCPSYQRLWVRAPLPQRFFPPLFHGGLGHLSTLLNIADERLLGGRVVSVVTLPVMVSRLGWGSRFKSDPRLNAAGSLIKPVRDSWNVAGWVTPRQSRSR